MELFCSNRLDILYEKLKEALFFADTPPLSRRLVVVHSPYVQEWLTLKMAEDKELGVAMGVEFLTLSQAFDFLLSRSFQSKNKPFPSFHELAFYIEGELYACAHHFDELSLEEKEGWRPLIVDYLKMPISLRSPLSKKAKRRVVSLSFALARLFENYDRFASQMTQDWEKAGASHWQALLWQKVWGKNGRWQPRSRALSGEFLPSPSLPWTIHFFSISFITERELEFLSRLSQVCPVYYYLLSPCAIFWSDVRSDREALYLHNYWKKKGVSSASLSTMDAVLKERNPLLANLGKMAREMTRALEESHCHSYGYYALPESVKAFGEEEFAYEDLAFIPRQGPLKLLHAVQADLLVMRSPSEKAKLDIKEEFSIQLHIAASRRREIESLYHTLIDLKLQDPTLEARDILVLSANMHDYRPYIEAVFTNPSSPFSFYFSDLGLLSESHIVQGFLQLLNLSESRWSCETLLQLFAHSDFQRRHQLSKNDYALIASWIEKAKITWGTHFLHRRELLQKSHCQSEMVDETAQGTWEFGLARLILGLTTLATKSAQEDMPLLPCTLMEFSAGELLGRWIQLLHALIDDLSFLNDETFWSVSDWARFLKALLENYFACDKEDAHSCEDYEQLYSCLSSLSSCSFSLGEARYSFSSIKAHLMEILERSSRDCRQKNIEAIRFSHLEPMRSIPAKVIALIGMQEAAFPRRQELSSLDLSKKGESDFYRPTTADFDRSLFLEAMHAAEECLILSYIGYNSQEGKEERPSLLLEEFFSYLDRHYLVHNKKPSEACLHKHPIDAFDARYFSPSSALANFSMRDYSLAKASLTPLVEPHAFISAFPPLERSKESLAAVLEKEKTVALRDLLAAVRNPIRFTLQKAFEIYPERRQERQFKSEETFVLSSLDKHHILAQAVTSSMDHALVLAEKEGKLPFGLFKQVAVHKVKEEFREIEERLKRFGVSCADIFEIELCLSCDKPLYLGEKKWLVPALALEYAEGKELFITGRCLFASQKGLIVLSRANLSEAWKIWPQYLLYCYAAQLIPEKIEPNLIFAYGAAPKEPFFADPRIYLKELLFYYAHCLHKFSPLLPDWLPSIFTGDALKLRGKIEEPFMESFGSRNFSDLQLALNPEKLPDAEQIIAAWRPESQALVQELAVAWGFKG